MCVWAPSSSEDVKRKLEAERAKTSDRGARRVGLDLEIRNISESLRYGQEERSNKEKKIDGLKRDLKRKEINCESVKQDFPVFIEER